MKAMLLDADYFMNGQQPVVRMFCKTESGETVCVYNNKTMPYFYFKTKIPEEEILERIKNILSKTKLQINIKALETAYKFVPLGFMKDKEKLVKITLYNPQDVSKLRDILMAEGIADSVYEADIMFKYRFMVDNDLHGMQWIEFEPERVRTTTSKFPVYNAQKFMPLETQTPAPLRYMALDIECASMDQGRMPNENMDPIIMISIAFDPPFKGKANMVLVAKRVQAENTTWFQSEKEMLEEFVAITQAYDPDIVTGYNINGFDMPWLIKRAQKNDVKFDIPRSEKQIGMKKGLYPEYIIPGRILIDPFQILKRDPWQKFARYDLNTVSKVLLNDEKHDIEYGEISVLWNGSKDDVVRLIEYARKDVVLAMRLVKEKGMLDKFVEISKISGLLMQDTFGGQTKRIETMMLYEFRKRDFVMPFAKRKDNTEQSLKGAIVLEPRKGLHYGNCTVVLDFRSLYPSIMRTFNVSPDTLIVNEAGDLPYNLSPSGAKFVKQDIREGILPNLLAKLMKARSDAKTAMKAVDGDLKKTLNARQLALKDLSNSMYGFTGYARARLYMIEVASSITAYGRENIEKTTRLIKEKYSGFEVVYGDTDSVFIKVPTDDLNQAKMYGEEVAAFVSGELPGHLELVFEKIYKTFLILAKKRYAGWRYDYANNQWIDKIDMKGIETVRRDWCPLVSEVMVDVLSIVLKENNVKKAIENTKTIINNLRNNQVPLEKLTVIKGITRSINEYKATLPHIELAKKMRARDPATAPNVGDRLGFVIIKGSQLISKRAEDPKYVIENKLQIDSDYYIQSQLLPPLERIFLSVGVDRSELFGAGRQMTLGSLIVKKQGNILDGVEECVCDMCARSFRRMPLRGLCDCGGNIVLAYQGNVGNIVRTT
ncbi:MAG: hypothetical protein HY513_01580 [Candidatus Aenigmarchaeota archaeon]|nr:hypothetical protein [Candidatus Aenigmarchaeota archaeon]